MLIDKYLPTYHFNETHRTTIAAAPRDVLAAATQYDPASDPLFRLAIGLRELPARLRARLRGTPPVLTRPFGLHNFTLLEVSDEEVVYGLAGRFWQLDYGQVPIRDGAAFRAFDAPGSARLALRFSVSAVPGQGTTLITETRIQCLDTQARRSFRLYWILIRPVSGLIRRRMLAQIRRALAARA